MARRPGRRSTGKTSRPPTRAKPKRVRRLRFLEEQPPKADDYSDRWRVDGQGRAYHSWHPAETLYRRSLSQWLKVFLWCARCQVGVSNSDDSIERERP